MSRAGRCSTAGTGLPRPAPGLPVPHSATRGAPAASNHAGLRAAAGPVLPALTRHAHAEVAQNAPGEPQLAAVGAGVLVRGVQHLQPLGPHQDALGGRQPCPVLHPDGGPRGTAGRPVAAQLHGVTTAEDQLLLLARLRSRDLCGQDG